MTENVLYFFIDFYLGNIIYGLYLGNSILSHFKILNNQILFSLHYIYWYSLIVDSTNLDKNIFFCIICQFVNVCLCNTGISKHACHSKQNTKLLKYLLYN